MEMFEDNKGFGSIIMGVVGLVIFVILVASVAMPVIMGANTTGWTAATIAMWGILPIVIIASLVLYTISQK